MIKYQKKYMLKPETKVTEMDHWIVSWDHEHATLSEGDNK